MNVKHISINFVNILFVLLSSGTMAEEIVHFSFDEVQNIVSQKLAVAQSKQDYNALQEAKSFLPAIVTSDGTTIYRHITPEQTFLLRLQIFKVADSMQDKSFNPKTRTKAGIYGKVPWPTDKERPLNLAGKPLWGPGQDPEDFKDSKPNLYAIYKPLYDENLKNTEKHKREGLVRSIRKDLLRDVRSDVKNASLDKNDPQCHSRYVALVKGIIKDEQLQQRILSEEQIEDLSVK